MGWDGSYCIYCIKQFYHITLIGCHLATIGMQLKILVDVINELSSPEIFHDIRCSVTYIGRIVLYIDLGYNNTSLNQNGRFIRKPFVIIL